MRLTTQYHLVKINDAVSSGDIFERELLKCSGLLEFLLGYVIEGKGDDTTKILKRTRLQHFEGSVPQSRYNRGCLSLFQKWIFNQFLFRAVLKKNWADYEQLLRTVFSCFHGQKFFWGAKIQGMR